MPAPTTFPADPATWPAFLATSVDAGLDEGRALIARLKDGTPRTTSDVLELWNDADIAIGTASARAHLFAEVHPDAAVREAAEASAQAAEDLLTERGLDHELFGRSSPRPTRPASTPTRPAPASTCCATSAAPAWTGRPRSVSTCAPSPSAAPRSASSSPATSATASARSTCGPSSSTASPTTSAPSTPRARTASSR